MKKDKDITALIKDSKEKSWRQLDAIKTLGKYDDPRAVTALVNLLRFEISTNDYRRPQVKIAESTEVRWEATKALIAIGKKSVQPLLSVLENTVPIKGAHEVYRNLEREEAVWALGEIRDERAVESLFKIITNRMETKEIQTVAINALVKIGEPSIKYLIKALKSNGEEYRYVLAGTALTAIGSPSVEPLINVLDDPDFRLKAIDILGMIGGSRTTESLILVLAKHPKGEKKLDGLYQFRERYVDEDIHYAVRRALQNIGEPALSVLIDSLESKNEMIRLGSARALGLLGDPRSVEPLIIATRDDNEKVRWAALGSLRRTVGNLEELQGEKSVVDMTIIEKLGYPELCIKRDKDRAIPRI